MPLYEFVCPACQHRFEALVRHDERAVCPKCCNSETQRCISLPGMPLVSSSSPGSCPSDLPPCGPGCCRLPA